MLPSKQELRKQMLQAVATITPAQRQLASQELVKLLGTWPVWQKANSVLIFIPTLQEPDLKDLWTAGLASGKDLFLPFIKKVKLGKVTDINKLQPSQGGLTQPVNELHKSKWPEFDLIFMPGLAFDLQGNRLGHGSGWYDRFFGEYQKIYRKPTTVVAGICFEAQIIAKVPVEAHDKSCEYVVSAKDISKISA